jgi:cytochrome c oxidase assembly protein subunit 11
MSVAAQNQLLLKKLLAVVLLMLAFAFALVPFYRKICEVTGVNQTRVLLSSVQNTQVDSARSVTVEFLASNSGQLAWQFEPLQKSVTIHPGEISRIAYRVVNTQDAAVVGQAVPSFGPASAGKYVKKLECFCFRPQLLAAHETREMPVVFLISRDLPADVGTVTVSYTFFDVTAETPG